ncbi:TPA: NUDIX domain-containing protein [Candidatus Woesearchaeota archaeon]|nr:NUDIX domain-containing protein [Candidatus Woesearchaeota archaeon]
MSVPKLLSSKQEERIFSLFLEHETLRFSEIEKKIGLRSNLLAYHLSILQRNGVIRKTGDCYSLTSGAERYLPSLSHIATGELSPVPVVLVAVMRNKKTLLLKRRIRPYKEYWGVVGGKLRFDETLQDATVRLVREKAGVECEFMSLNTVSHERVRVDRVVKHSFLLFFVKAIVVKDRQSTGLRRDDLRWATIDALPKKGIVPSDRWLLEHKMSSKIPLNRFTMDEKDGNIISFDVQK